MIYVTDESRDADPEFFDKKSIDHSKCPECFNKMQELKNKLFCKKCKLFIEK